MVKAPKKDKRADYALECSVAANFGGEILG